MRPFGEPTHYEVLEISPDATLEEVERAYRIVQGTYREDSMAVYALLTEEDVAATRERVEVAYEILSDPSARQRYDLELGDDEVVWHADDGDLAALQEEAFVPEVETPAPAPARPEVAASIAGFEDVDEDGGTYDGSRLRRARLLRGVEIEQIADVTKINPTYLHFIEQERFDELPATVYVRGFVTAYARCIGLDPSGASLSYVERLQDHRGEQRPLGRAR